MRLTVQHFAVRSTDCIDALIEQRILALHSRLRIEEAQVRLERAVALSPRFRVMVHLVVPGPDLEAEGRGHTIQAAIENVSEMLEIKVRERETKLTRRARGNRQSPTEPRRRSTESGKRLRLLVR